MNWSNDELRSPFSGKPLRLDSAHSFSDGAQRFPIIDEIPFLRAERDELTTEVLEKLDAGEPQAALILLLQDQDDWARTPAPTAEDLQPLFDNENLTLREAMRCLKYEAVADYFAYRWSDPTFLSGLKLLETHLPDAAENVFELACGIGHFLREFERRNIGATGADVVFSKLWLARRFVAPTAKLVCLDANHPLPFADDCFDAAFCHDAFYFLPNKARVAEELKRTTRAAVLIGHAHNADAENFSSGAAIPTADYAKMFEKPVFYDDAELTVSFVENRAVQSNSVAQLAKTEAVSWATNHAQNKAETNFHSNKSAADLRVNPLFFDEKGELYHAPQYPSKRYEDEYAALSGYLNLSAEEAEKLRNFPAQKLSKTEIENFLRRRILIDLPPSW